MLKSERYNPYILTSSKEQSQVRNLKNSSSINAFKRNSLSSRVINCNSNKNEAFPHSDPINENDFIEIKNSIKAKFGTQESGNNMGMKQDGVELNRLYDLGLVGNRSNSSNKKHLGKPMNEGPSSSLGFTQNMKYKTKNPLLLSSGNVSPHKTFKPFGSKDNLDTGYDKDNIHQKASLSIPKIQSNGGSTSRDLPTIGQKHTNFSKGYHNINITAGENSLKITKKSSASAKNPQTNPHHFQKFDSAHTLGKTTSNLVLNNDFDTSARPFCTFTRPIKNNSYSTSSPVNHYHNTFRVDGSKQVTTNKKPHTTTKQSKNETKFKLYSKSCVIEYAHKEEQNMPYRSYMEDFVKVNDMFMGDPNKIIFGLYDGHGGSDVAKIVKEKLPELFSKYLSEGKGTVEGCLVNAFKKQDEQLKKYESVGSTANLVYICKENNRRVLYSANIGDSRTVLIRSNKAERVSYDHKGTDHKEIERIRLGGGIIFAGRVFGQLAISRAFGDFSLKNYGVSSIPYVTKNNIEDTDSFLVMGSDGLWDVINEDFVYKLSLCTNSAEDLAKTLVQNAITLGSIDNISCIVVRLN